MTENRQVTTITEDKLNSYLSSLGNKLPEAQKQQFIEIAKAFNLNPFKKEIYGIGFGDKFNIIVGYEVYIKRAERSGLLSGWKVWTEGSIQNNLKAVIQINRKDWNEPFKHEVYFQEYRQNSPIWQNKPLTMIKKVAIAQGFRLCFPTELGGMPYTSDEIPTQEIEVEVVDTAREEILKIIKSHKIDPKHFSKFAKDNNFDLSNYQFVLENRDKLEKLLEQFKGN